MSFCCWLSRGYNRPSCHFGAPESSGSPVPPAPARCRWPPRRPPAASGTLPIAPRLEVAVAVQAPSPPWEPREGGQGVEQWGTGVPHGVGGSETGCGSVPHVVTHSIIPCSLWESLLLATFGPLKLQVEAGAFCGSKRPAVVSAHKLVEEIQDISFEELNYFAFLCKQSKSNFADDLRHPGHRGTNENKTSRTSTTLRTSQRTISTLQLQLLRPTLAQRKLR